MGPALYFWSFVTSAQQAVTAMALTKPITVSQAGGDKAGERVRMFREESCPGAQGHICSTPMHGAWFLEPRPLFRSVSRTQLLAWS